ncbi:TPA: hypothetical protein ACGO8F_001416 [Streptococcus suis]
MTILEDVKELLEVDLGEDIYDKQLLLYVNAGLRYLINSGVPLFTIEEDDEKEVFTNIEEGDYSIVLQYLHLFTLQRFDRSLMTGGGTTQDWIDSELLSLLQQLKIKYDRGDAT